MAEQSTVAVIAAPTGRPTAVRRWFYISIALLIIVLNVVAFGPSIVEPSRRNVPLPLTTLVTAHAILAAAWLLLFLAQTTLVATSRTAVHRRLGIFGAVLTVAFIVVGCSAVIAQARRGWDLSGDISRLPPPSGADPLAAVVGLLVFFLIFGMLVGAALWYRHRPGVHKRLTLLAVLGGLTPTPVAHVIGHWSVLQRWTALIFPLGLFVFLSFSAIYDRASEGRIHPVSLWVGILVFVGSALFNVVIVPSSAWHQFALWLIR